MSMMIPRPFRPTEAKRRQEEAARLAERRDGSRKTSATTISSGGRLDVDGGDLTVQNGGSAVIKDGGEFRVEGGGSLTVTEDGEVTVFGSGGWFGSLVNIARATFGNRLTTDGLGLQPMLYFEIPGGTPTGPAAAPPRISSADGTTLEIASGTDDPVFGRYSSLRVEQNQIALSHTEPIGGAFAGIYIRQTGKVELIAATGGIEFGGNTNVTGAFTVNGLPITVAWTSVSGKPSTFPPIIGTTSTTAKAGDWVPAISDVTGLTAALAAKSDKPGAWTLLTVTTGTPLDGNKAAIRREADGASLRLAGGILFTGSVSAGATLATIPVGWRTTTNKNFLVAVPSAISPYGVIRLACLPDGTITGGPAFASGTWVDFGSIAPIPTDSPT